MQFIAMIEAGATIKWHIDCLIVCPPDKTPYKLFLDGSKKTIEFKS